jgi:flagellar hook-associated protein 3 FlgL
MSIVRVSNAQTFALLVARTGRLEVTLRRLQDQVASGKRLVGPADDPAAAAQVVRSRASLAGLAQYAESSRFGTDVLGAEDKALGEAHNLITRAEEIATQQASGLLTAEERLAAAEEVHGILQGLTALGNSELAGRRLFGGLALDAPPPFTDPDAVGYDPASAYTGSTQEFSVKIGSGASERVRVSTRGDAVFGDALVGVAALEAALRTNGNVAGTLAGLAQARATLAAERASVGGRQAQLVDRTAQISGLEIREEATRAGAEEADLVRVISELVQVQTALETTLQAGARVAQTSLAALIQL